MTQTRNEPADTTARLPFESLPVHPAGQSFDMLAGVTVLDLTTSVAGPYATMLLSDFGADVIKIERPAGDDARSWGPPFHDEQALWFTAVNRNKRSVVVDAQTEQGREDLLALVRGADVIVTNQPPAVQRKLGLDYDTLRKERADLIFVSITGFGLDGERADLTCYDLIAEGYSGIMDITGAAGGEPQKIGAPAADMLAGQDAAMATIAALLGRHRTGEGHLIDVSLVESMTRFLTCRISPYLGSGDVPTRSGGRDSVIAIYQPFDTADLPMTLGLGSDAIWKRFWDAVGDPDYGARPEFRTNADRRRDRPAIVARIQEILRSRTRDDWLRLFAGARVPAGPINRVDEVVSDRHLQERGLFYGLEDETGRVAPQIGLGIRIDGQASYGRRLPPPLGADTEAVLGALRTAHDAD
ncbi:CaiB/BaiF CoA transferase family protein [Celeribacter indicus]|uniref:L-carnitine dehydratase/bile acid-inducible protein F n=1 Tax=Celeribacter indicus TaxID=1208324 RepID=A0A0B5E0N5_9RHOB|nr:CoA transferase [Celeribacter indicus]AJE49198.1 L-carnitine dehydratase/bile acid-inducible protein F [Celeribacter indicus]SDX18616.1 Crotonobetainyl-CoA:carnitine CoA-transferase CaiB [Celeribacter indicus]